MQEVKYAGQTRQINVVMKDDVEVLEDVVVTGYGNMSKGNYRSSDYDEGRRYYDGRSFFD